MSDNSLPEGRQRDAAEDRRPADSINDILKRAGSLPKAFPSLIPAKPYCADDLSDGLKIRRKESALQKRHIQLNHPAALAWVVHDIDHLGAYSARHDGNVPEANVIIVNPKNGHAHSAILLAVPVACHSAARLAPLRFFAAVERGIARRIDADRHYTGLIAKNPLHSAWRVEWRRDKPYTLPELADWLFPQDMRPFPSVGATHGTSRNCTVFDQLRAIAYREVREFKRRNSFEAFQARLEHLALGINLQFPEALRFAEVRAITRSVAKWTWRHFSTEKFRIRQSMLGKRANAVRWAGHLSADSTKPRETEGISRATWYRRKAKA